MRNLQYANEQEATMKELTNKQKKDYARILFLKENLTQQEIAARTGISRQTLSRWINTEKWEEMKIGMTLTREQQISAIHRQVAEINKAIQSREEGKRYATPSEADTLGKLATTIKKLESDVGISDIISVGMRFGDWLRPQDPEMTKQFIRLFDLFIKDNL